jgi:serine/threonine protein kinase
MLSHSTTSTQTGSLMGTPAFMAPEQARGRWSEVDARTDLWAVGATMFLLLSGRPVHEAETANETLARVITEPAPPVESLGSNLTTSITTLVDRALAYDKAATRRSRRRPVHSRPCDWSASRTGRRRCRVDALE